MGKHPLFRHLRGTLVALHIVALLVMATPSTHGIRVRSAWSDATVQDEFQAWSGALHSLGFDLDSESLEESLWSLTRRYARARKRGVAIFEPYAECCGTWQSWRMFSAPHRHPSRLAIDVEREGRWERVYRARSSEQNWRAGQFDHVRLRSLVFRAGWLHERRVYRGLVRWIAERAAADFADAAQVRVLYLKGRSPTPEELRTGRLPALTPRKTRIVPLTRGAQR